MTFCDITNVDHEADGSITDTHDCSTDTSHQDCSSATVEQVLPTLQSASWDFSMFRDGVTICITTDSEISKITHTGRGTAPSWNLKYPALPCLMNGQYYVEYHDIFGMTDTPVMSEVTWNKVDEWLGKHVKELAEVSCKHVCQNIEEHGEKFSWVASYDGFYLTQGYHSNNSSGTLHDVATDKIPWFSHSTKRGSEANWEEHYLGLRGPC